MTNKCIHCGHALPEGASFCPWCEKEQVLTVMARGPRLKRRIPVVVSLILLAVLAVFLFMAFRHTPETYEGDSALLYPLGSGQVKILLSFDSNAGSKAHETPEKTVSLAEGEQSAVPSWLFVLREGEEDAKAADAFEGALGSCSVEVVPEGDGTDGADGVAGADGAMIEGPHEAPKELTGAVRGADLIYRAGQNVYRIIWTLEMKNGDVIRLSHRLKVETIQTVDLHYEEVPLATAAEIREALEKATPGANVNLYLPPVTYDEPLILDERTACLYGSREGEKVTIFTDTLSINNRNPSPAGVYDIVFDGKNRADHVGLLAHEGVLIEGCTFTGWEVGVDGAEGSWPVMENCTFTDNRIGFRFNSTSSSLACDVYPDLTFTGNETGVQLVRVPGDLQIRFSECVFADNLCDIDAPEDAFLVD